MPYRKSSKKRFSKKRSYKRKTKRFSRKRSVSRGRPASRKRSSKKSKKDPLLGWTHEGARRERDDSVRRANEAFNRPNQLGAPLPPLGRGGGLSAGAIGAITRVHARNHNGSVPDRLLTKFNWTHQSAVNVTAPGLADYIRSGSLFDPLGSASSGQNSVEYFEQWANFYQFYRVYGCHIKVTFMATDINATTGNMVCGILPYVDASNLPTTFPIFRDWPNGRYKALGALNSDKTQCTISMYMNAESLLAPAVNPGDLYGYLGTPNVVNTGGNPQTTAAFALMVFPGSVGSGVGYSWSVSCTYYAELFEPRPSPTYTAYLKTLTQYPLPDFVTKDEDEDVPEDPFAEVPKVVYPRMPIVPPPGFISPQVKESVFLPQAPPGYVLVKAPEG